MRRSGFLAVGMLALATARAEAAGPNRLRLTHQRDPATSVAVSWNSDDPADPTVAWGTDPAAPTGTAEAWRSGS